MKNAIIAILALVIIGAGVYFVIKNNSPATPTNSASPAATTSQPTNATSATPVGTTSPATPQQASSTAMVTKTVIGKSAGGHDIVAYHYGHGSKEVMLIAGLHAGYAWSPSLFGYDFVKYLKDNASSIPSNLSLTIIPTVNPDGQLKTLGTAGSFTAAAIPANNVDRLPGRFNANGVDLNRNFDCNWSAQGKWINDKTVDGGSAAFSEPEAVAIRDYVEAHKPTAVIAYYASAGAVYSSSCGNSGVLPLTSDLTNVYASAAGYTAHKTYQASYTLTGDMTNWLAKIGVPAISVLFTNYSDPEWTKNEAGTLATLDYISKH